MLPQIERLEGGKQTLGTSEIHSERLGSNRCMLLCKSSRLNNTKMFMIRVANIGMGFLERLWNLLPLRLKLN